MAQNYCNTELSLSLSSNLASSSSSRLEDWLQEARVSRKNQQEKMTILYNGKMCVCDVTELQAKAIISMANDHKQSCIDQSLMSSSSCEHEMINKQFMNPRLSMKRSLQQFLQKRKIRMDEASPYAFRTDRNMSKL